MGNFFGGSTSLGLEVLKGKYHCPGDNGIYVIDGKEIKERLIERYDEDTDTWNMRLFSPEWEQQEY